MAHIFQPLLPARAAVQRGGKESSLRQPRLKSRAYIPAPPRPGRLTTAALAAELDASGPLTMVPSMPGGMLMERFSTENV